MLQYLTVKGTSPAYFDTVQKKVWGVSVCVLVEREGMSKQENRGKCKNIGRFC